MTTVNPRAALLAGLFLVAACGGGSPATQGTQPTTGAPAATTPAGATAGTTATQAPAATMPPTGVIDTCTLLTAADIKTATGKDYGAPADDGYGQCIWLAGTDTVNTGNGMIVLTVVDSSLDTLKGMFTGGVDLTISGKAAYWNPAAGLETLWVDLGGRVLQMSLNPVNEGTQAVAQKLAEAALTKL